MNYDEAVLLNSELDVKETSAPLVRETTSSIQRFLDRPSNFALLCFVVLLQTKQARLVLGNNCSLVSLPAAHPMLLVFQLQESSTELNGLTFGL